MAHNILVFSEERSFLYIAMEEQLKGLGYNVINVGTNVNEINAVKEDITAALIYTDEEMIKKQQALVFDEKVNVSDIFVMGKKVK